jgi:hypothetical protein
MLPQIVQQEPTYFNELLLNAMHVSSCTPPGKVYHVLLILTDGNVQDMRETIESIVESSYNCPLSFIIVGIGGGDFALMDVLDADINPLQDT